MGKFKFYKQLDSMDCGVACVKMIAKYYGKEFSVDFLRSLTYPTRTGISLQSISILAEKIGFKTIGGRITYKKLVQDAPLPCILHWEQEHFVVLIKIRKNKWTSKVKEIVVLDPSKGRIAYTEEEFKNFWVSTQRNDDEMGVCLFFETTPNFKEQDNNNKNSSSSKFISKYFIKNKKYFFQLVLGFLLVSIIQFIFPFLTKSIVDIGIYEKNIRFIYLILIAQIVLILSRMLVDLIRNWLVLHISTRINLSMISDFFIKLMKLPMSYFDTKLPGDILQRLEDNNRIEKFIALKSVESIYSISIIIIFSIVLLVFSTKILLLFFASSILYFIWTIRFLKRRKVLDFKFFDQKSRIQSLTYQLITGMQEMKLHNYQTIKRWDWEDAQADLFQLNIQNLKLNQEKSIGNFFIEESKNVLITFFAAYSVIQGEITLGVMIAIQYIIGQLSSPIEHLLMIINEIQDVKISLERINEIQSKKDENFDKKNTIFKPFSKDLEIENLVFQYEGPSSPKVLNNITVKIPSGKITAIVGESGSGKTTLIKLLLLFYPPTEGKILIGQDNINDIDPSSWREQCGVVMQDGFIFHETIAQNIALCNLNNINKNKLQAAAEIANIHDFVMGLPLKYNTLIGDEGQNISQGQKQRILIARAVYKDPDFIFFDEATNSLDANNEKAIVENLQSFYKGKTVIIVAHRLSTVKNADQIIVLDKGQIVECGDHDSLIEKKGAYFNLVKNQLELGN